MKCQNEKKFLTKEEFTQKINESFSKSDDSEDIYEGLESDNSRDSNTDTLSDIKGSMQAFYIS